MQVLFMCTANSCRSILSEAAGEPCPVYFGPALKAHWGLEDPSEVDGDEATIDAAFNATLAIIERRCNALFALPFNTLGHDELQRELDRIGTL